MLKSGPALVLLFEPLVGTVINPRIFLIWLFEEIIGVYSVMFARCCVRFCLHDVFGDVSYYL